VDLAICCLGVTTRDAPCRPSLREPLSAERLVSRELDCRIPRLEQVVGSWSDEPVGCELSDEAEDVFAAMSKTAGKIESGVNRRSLTPCPDVADMSPAEREQRLLAIGRITMDRPAVRAFLDQALDDTRRLIRPCTRESNATLDQANALSE
jgi:hypothetical protein